MTLNEMAKQRENYRLILCKAEYLTIVLHLVILSKCVLTTRLLSVNICDEVLVLLVVGSAKVRYPNKYMVCGLLERLERVRWIASATVLHASRDLGSISNLGGTTLQGHFLLS